MNVASTRGSAVFGLSLFIGLAVTGMARSASVGGGVGSCTSASYCTPAPQDCTFPGPNPVWPTVVADLPDGVSSDGRGPYLLGKDGVVDSRAGAEATLGIWGDTVRNVRSVTVNLSKPVPGGGGVPLGINTGTGRFITQRGMIGDTVQNMTDIAVGQTERAAMMSAMFSINGRLHVLQVGPQAIGHCTGGKNLVHGTGTSSGTIFRATQTKWVMDIPAGSVGRLFDIQLSDCTSCCCGWDHAVDKGLYYVHLHYEIGR